MEPTSIKHLSKIEVEKRTPTNKKNVEPRSAQGSKTSLRSFSGGAASSLGGSLFEEKKGVKERGLKQETGDPTRQWADGPAN